MEQIALPDSFEVLVVPEAPPQTKPKALNYGLQFARGDLVAIYDAEDMPARGQLRLAAETFAASPSGIVCLQARLAFYNAGENWLTRGIMAQTPQRARSRHFVRLGGIPRNFAAFDAKLGHLATMTDMTGTSDG